MDILQSEQYKILLEYRVSFILSSKSHFMAAERCKYEEDKAANRKKWWEIGSIVVSIFAGFGCFGAGFSEKHWEIVAGILSFFSTGISIYTLTKHIEIKSTKHHQQADAYLALYKKIKNLEARAKDGQLNYKLLTSQIDSLQHEQEKLQKNEIIVADSDYEKAKKAIAEGQTSYTDADFKNT